MFKRNMLILVVVLAGAIALATVGIVRAQTANTNTSGDTQVTATTNTNTANTNQPATQPCTGKHQAKLDEMAKLFNMSVDDLQKEFQSGKQFYQIAAEHGVTYDKLNADRLSELKTKLDDMVKVGFMTQSEADQIYQQAQEEPMMFGFGHFGFGHGMRWGK